MHPFIRQVLTEPCLVLGSVRCCGSKAKQCERPLCDYIQQGTGRQQMANILSKYTGKLESNVCCENRTMCACMLRHFSRV